MESSVFDYSGPASLLDLNSTEWKQSFRQCEEAQRIFSSQNLYPTDYPWPRDPLHTWSRIWEYPYVNQHIADFMRSRLSPSPRPVVVDFGSGVTFFPSLLAENNHCEVICIDNNESFAKAFEPKNGLKPVTFLASNGWELPLGTASADAVYSVSVLEHVPDCHRLVKEFARVLKPEGLLCITIDIELDPTSNIGLHPASRSQLYTELSEHFCYRRDPKTVAPSELLTTLSSPYPMGVASSYSRKIAMLAKDFARVILGRSLPNRRWFLTCEGVVLTRKREDEHGSHDQRADRLKEGTIGSGQSTCVIPGEQAR